MKLSLRAQARELWHDLLTRVLHLLGALQIQHHAPPKGRLLVIAPHPDDEILGCGGILCSALERQQQVDILYLTDGEGTGVHPDPARIRAERQQIADRVMTKLNIPADRLHRWRLPDGGVPRQGAAGFEAAATRLADLIDTLKPDWLLATHALDYWPYDHVACAELASAAVAQSRRRPRVGLYWVWAWYNLRPWRLQLKRHPGLKRIDISPWANTKRELVGLYLNPLSPSGQPWSGQLPKALRWAALQKIEILEVMDER
jgi:LmbE family N-acetylglucosaminyl deacetylase